MNTLTLSAIRCTLNHINVRKEGNEEDGLELANDLKFVLKTRGDVALRALGAEGLIPALYDKHDNLICPAIKALSFALEMDNHTLGIEGNAPDFDGVKLKAFALEFSGPGPEANLTFMAQIHPSPEEQAMIVEFLREDVVLTVTPPNTLPGVARAGKLEDVPTKAVESVSGKSEKGDNTICPECNKPFTEKDTSVQISTKDKKSPRLHSKCFDKRANRAVNAMKKGKGRSKK